MYPNVTETQAYVKLDCDWTL